MVDLDVAQLAGDVDRDQPFAFLAILLLFDCGGQVLGILRVRHERNAVLEHVHHDDAAALASEIPVSRVELVDQVVLNDQAEYFLVGVVGDEVEKRRDRLVDLGLHMTAAQGREGRALRVRLLDNGIHRAALLVIEAVAANHAYSANARERLAASTRDDHGVGHVLAHLLVVGLADHAGLGGHGGHLLGRIPDILQRADHGSGVLDMIHPFFQELLHRRDNQFGPRAIFGIYFFRDGECGRMPDDEPAECLEVFGGQRFQMTLLKGLGQGDNDIENVHAADPGIHRDFLQVPVPVLLQGGSGWLRTTGPGVRGLDPGGPPGPVGVAHLVPHPLQGVDRRAGGGHVLGVVVLALVGLGVFLFPLQSAVDHLRCPALEGGEMGHEVKEHLATEGDVLLDHADTRVAHVVEVDLLDHPLPELVQRDRVGVRHVGLHHALERQQFGRHGIMNLVDHVHGVAGKPGVTGQVLSGDEARREECGEAGAAGHVAASERLAHDVSNLDSGHLEILVEILFEEGAEFPDYHGQNLVHDVSDVAVVRPAQGRIPLDVLGPLAEVFLGDVDLLRRGQRSLPAARIAVFLEDHEHDVVVFGAKSPAQADVRNIFMVNRAHDLGHVDLAIVAHMLVEEDVDVPVLVPEPVGVLEGKLGVGVDLREGILLLPRHVLLLLLGRLSNAVHNDLRSSAGLDRIEFVEPLLGGLLHIGHGLLFVGGQQVFLAAAVYTEPRYVIGVDSSGFQELAQDLVPLLLAIDGHYV